MTCFSCNALKCVSTNNQECKVRPEILIDINSLLNIINILININSNEPLFYPYSVIKNKCSGSCNNINNSYDELCVPDVIKDMNIKVFNLMSRTNETRHASWHETCECKCRLDASVCNDKER